MGKRRKSDDYALTDAEVEEYNRHWHAIPVEVRIARSRKLNIGFCLTWRRYLAEGCPNPDVDEETAELLLSKAQKQLLKLRIWRSTGQYPNEN